MSDPAPTGSSPASPAQPAPAAGPASAQAVPTAVAAPPPEPLISIDEFHKVKLVTGEVLSAEAHPKADRLLVLQVKIGDQTRQIVSGIRQWYTPEQLVGRTIIVVANLQPAKLRGIESNGMLLAVSVPGGLRLLATDGPAPSGLPVT